MPTLTQVLFALISFGQFVILCMTFIDLNTKRGRKNLMPEAAIYLTWGFFFYSHLYTFILGYICRQISKRNSFFADQTFNYKAAIRTTLFVVVFWLAVTHVASILGNLGYRNSPYIALFALTDALATAVFSLALSRGKEMLEKGDQIDEKEVESVDEEEQQEPNERWWRRKKWDNQSFWFFGPKVYNLNAFNSFV
ncbi:hypothetical protein M3Y97_00660100 [Aphelenchoides bicaudatus]|nr:hypothetical protein M3Y97_00660100 [Aphelenchoides bicaudatus]